MAGDNLETSMSTPSIAAPAAGGAHERRHPRPPEAAACPGGAPAGASPSWPEEEPTAFPSPSTPTRPCTSASWSAFYQGHWSYVGLEAEIPKPGDFKRTAVGERSVIRCATRMDRCAWWRTSARIAACSSAERHGNRSEFVCPYHQWNYDLQGNLIGVPFRRGVKQDGKVNGGMPPDFKPEEHGLTKLAVACRNGVVFASFDHEVEPLEDYLGPDILHYFDRVFDGRELVIHGYSRQRIPATGS